MRKSICLFILMLSCTPQQKKDLKTALDFAQIACLLAAPSLDSDEAMQLCKVVEDARPAVQELMASKAVARKAAAKCPQ